MPALRRVRGFARVPLAGLLPDEVTTLVAALPECPPMTANPLVMWAMVWLVGDEEARARDVPSTAPANHRPRPARRWPRLPIRRPLAASAFSEQDASFTR